MIIKDKIMRQIENRKRYIKTLNDYSHIVSGDNWINLNYMIKQVEEQIAELEQKLKEL